MSKVQLRARAAAHREQLALLPQLPDRAAFLTWLDTEYPTSAAISAYFPMNNEMDVLPLMEALAIAGYRTALPVVTTKGGILGFRQWEPGDPLEEGHYHTQQPLASAPSLLPDIALVPLLAFDTTGNRLGYGGGYYDRTLATLQRSDHHCLAIGVGYAAQQVETIPAESHDSPLHGVLTETGLGLCIRHTMQESE